MLNDLSGSIKAKRSPNQEKPHRCSPKSISLILEASPIHNGLQSGEGKRNGMK